MSNIRSFRLLLASLPDFQIALGLVILHTKERDSAQIRRILAALAQDFGRVATLQWLTEDVRIVGSRDELLTPEDVNWLERQIGG